MSARASIFDLRCRNETICRVCFLATRQRPTAAHVQQPWIATYSSQATSRGRTRTRARSQGRSNASKKPTQSELLKALQGSPEASNNEAFDVRYFEQDEAKRVELPDDGSFEQGLSGMDASGLKNTLFHMKDSLRSGKEKDAFEEVLGQMGGSMRTEDDIEKMMANMGKYTADIDAEIEATAAQLPRDLREQIEEQMAELMPKLEGIGSQRAPIPQIPEELWTLNQRKKISRLNSVISQVSRDMRRPAGLTEKHVLAVYKAYNAARRSLSNSWASVPIDVWDFFWKVFAVQSDINKHRFTHVSLLSRDMAEAGTTLTHPQQLLTIEALFVDGWETKAIENWKRCVATLGSNAAETFQDFWGLGVRMYCRVGDADHAESSAQMILDAGGDPRILLPLIRALSERGTPDDHEKAWAAYRRMRELLGQDMKLKDYDRVVSYFLTTNQVENALYAFVDMMSDGQIDLKHQKSMPSVVANKFFLGKWLKRLIGAGDFDGAYSVVEFMREKGVQAAPIHLNGLIGAWQRSGGADNMDKADALAWKMVESRVDFVRAREAAKDAITQPKGSEKVHIAPWPRATLETFCVLAENYRNRGLQDEMNKLWEAFREAKISPDAFMMNQLLESHLQSGQVEEAQALYHTLVYEQGVSPDPYTFSALWKTPGINRLHNIDEKVRQKDIKAARALFAETAKYKDVFQEEGIDIQLSRKILHTFRRLEDNASFLVALTALKEHFKFLPAETLIMELVLATRKLSWNTPAQRKKLMVAKRDIDRELMAWAESDDPTKLEGEERGVALYEYLQKKFWPSEMEDDEERAQMLVEVSKQMGVYDLLMKAGDQK